MPEHVAVSAGMLPSEDAARNSVSVPVGVQHVRGLVEILSSVTMISRVNAAVPLFVIKNSNVITSPTAENEAVGLLFTSERPGAAPVGIVAVAFGEVTDPLVPVALFVTDPRSTSLAVTV